MARNLEYYQELSRMKQKYLENIQQVLNSDEEMNNEPYEPDTLDGVLLKDDRLPEGYYVYKESNGNFHCVVHQD